ELLGVVHDEHALHIELQAARRFAMVEIERSAAGYIKQAGIFELAFDLVMTPGQGVLEVMGYMFVELLVFLLLDLGARAGPQGAGPVDALPLDLGGLVL